MPSRRLRLIAWIALAAFLVANGAAVAHPSLPSPHCHCGDALCNPSEGDRSDDTPASVCPHFHAKQKRQIIFGSSQGSDHREIGPFSPDCPCREQNPTKPSCPCPGGCMFCSVAKVPCVTPTIASLASSPCTGRCFAEAPPICFPPFCGKLMRPPRA